MSNNWGAVQNRVFLSLFREIIVDNFAGGGWASTGIEMATGDRFILSTLVKEEKK